MKSPSGKPRLVATHTYRLVHQSTDSLGLENHFLHIKGFINYLETVTEEFFLTQGASDRRRNRGRFADLPGLQNHRLWSARRRQPFCRANGSSAFASRHTQASQAPCRRLSTLRNRNSSYPGKCQNHCKTKTREGTSLSAPLPARGEYFEASR